MHAIRPSADAYGQEIWAHFKGGSPFEIVERDDGYIDGTNSTSGYFAPFSNWPRRQKKAIRLVAAGACSTSAVEPTEWPFFCSGKGFTSMR
jgi:hypothetical protein